MHIRTLSAYPLHSNESYNHLSPQASEALLSLKKIQNFTKKEQIDVDNVTNVRKNTEDRPSTFSKTNITKNIIQVSHRPVQNESPPSSQNYSFLQNSKQTQQLQYCTKLNKDDEQTPDFQELLSSDRKSQLELAQSQQFFQKQLQMISNLQAQQNKVILQEKQQKNFNKLEEKENINIIFTKSQMKNKINKSHLITCQSNQKTSIKSNINQRKYSQTSINTQSSSINRCNSSLQKDYMYQQAKIQQENFKTFVEQGKVQNEKKQLKECTFNPKINKSIVSNNSFFQRQDNWVRKKNDKISLQQEIKKEKQLRECTFSPNGRDLSDVRVNSCDVYYRNQQWQNKINSKKQKQKTRNSMDELDIREMKILQRSCSTQMSNKQADLKLILGSQVKLDLPKKVTYSTPLNQQTEKSATPISQNGCEFQKRKSSLEDIDQKYQLLFELVHKIAKTPKHKKH